MLWSLGGFKIINKISYFFRLILQCFHHIYSIVIAILFILNHPISNSDQNQKIVSYFDGKIWIKR